MRSAWKQRRKQVGIEFINLAKMQFDPRVLPLLPQTMMVQHKVIPVAFINNRLTLAMVNPNNIIALDDIRRVIKGVMIEPVVTTDEDFPQVHEHHVSHAHEKGSCPGEVKTDLTGSADLTSRDSGSCKQCRRLRLAAVRHHSRHADDGRHRTASE